MSSMEQRSVKSVYQGKCSSDITDAVRAFNEVAPDGSVPLVLVPSKRAIPAYFLIPQNAQAVMQCDGAHVAVLDAGRHSADDLLHAVAEEAVRTLVRSIDHTAVYELRSSCSETLQNILNHTFNKFGVQFSSTTVKNVSLPPLISVSLENASKVDSQIEKHTKEHEYAMKKISDTSDLELKRRSVQEEEHLTNLKSLLERTVIDGQKQVSECKREGERAIIKAEQEAETRITAARASLRDEQTKAKTEAERKVQQATAEKQNETRRIDQWSKEELMKSEQELTIAKNEYDIIKMKVEAKENENMKGIREQEVALRQTAALDELARKGRLVVSGESGKKLLEQFTF